MKKLNITKEAFEKSNYFKNKYGNLEYVSESGKVFKTDKGKLLKFKESASKGFEKFCEELKTKFSNIDGVRIYLMDNEDGTYTITVSIRRFDDARSVWYPEDVKKIGQFIKRKCDRFGWTVEKNVEYRLGITDFYITEVESSKDSSDEVVKESDKKFGRKFKESHTDMSVIEDKLAAALNAEIRTMTPDDIQVVSESELDEMGVSTIFVLLQNAFQSRKFTDEEKTKLLNADPKLISQMVLDIIDRSLPQSKGALVLALGLARDTVKKMSDTDWKDIVEYALNNPDNL